MRRACVDFWTESSPIVRSALALALWVAFVVVVTGLVTRGNAYSPDWNYRLQTDAFLSGRFAVAEHPYAHGHDWNWGRGMQQNWGLGAPLLRLPFEALTKALAGAYFPDRIVFAFYFLVSCLMFQAGLATVLRGFVVAGDRWLSRSLFLTLICYSSPVWLALLATRFDVYEEAIAYSFLWAMALLGGLLAFVRRPSLARLLPLCLLAGFASLIRPTGFFDGLATIAVVSLVALERRLPRTQLAIALAVYALGPLSQLSANLLRHGSPFEFGYELNIPSNYALRYMLRLSYPFATEPFFSALRELLGSLFAGSHYNGFDYFRASIHAWQSPTLRFREYYLPSYSLWMPLLVASGWGASLYWARRCLGRFTLRSLPRFSPRTPIAEAAVWLGLWSVLDTLATAGFYLRSPAFASRFVVDFLPAFTAGILVLGLSALHWLGLKLERRREAGLLALGAIVFVFGSTLHAQGVGGQRPAGYRQPAPVNLETVLQTRPATPLLPGALPSEYRCGEIEDRSGIPSNLGGWVSLRDAVERDPVRACRVSSSITLFLGSHRCLELELELMPFQGSYSLSSIRVRSGLEFLDPDALEVQGRRRLLRFCRAEPLGEQSEWNLVTVGFSPEREILGGQVPLWLRAVRAEP